MQSGSLVLLKINNDGGKFITIGGLKTTRFVLNNQILDCSNKDSGAWRQLLAKAGISHISISASGIFTDSKSERLIYDYAFSKTIRQYELHFGNGDKISGHFLISSYERSGNYNEEELYNITLESSGAVHYQVNTQSEIKEQTS